MIPLWFALAQKELGIKEAPGFANNPAVEAYFRDSGKGKQPDSVPWCAAFVGAMLERAGQRGTGFWAAQSYLNWGKALAQPIQGCIVVFKRGNSSWQGHVAFFDRMNKDGSIRVLGGNQADQVSYANFSTRNLLGYRWPKEIKIEIKEKT